MTGPNTIEAVLRTEAYRVFDGPGAGAHLTDEALEGYVRHGRAFDAHTKRHLASCPECRAVVGALVRESRPNVIPLGRRLQPWAAAGAVAAAAGFAAVVWVGPKAGRAPPPAAIALTETPDGAEHRGRKGEAAARLKADVALVATSTVGRRELERRDGVRLDERLGFIYGNPQGTFRSLAILGWDGREIHWYYPEGPDRPPFKIKRAPGTMAVRLPFDIQLAEKHRVGPLTVVAAFDADPAKLAAALRTGRVPADRGARLFQLEVKEAR